jgi:dihydroorotate dehydrogenase electron transfer subunit
MKKGIFTITENVGIAESVLRLTLEGDTSHITAPGQFVNIELDGFFLRRPISVCDWEEGQLRLIYKTVGNGTLALSRMSAGDRLDILTGLGNGCDLSKSGDMPLLIGGGAGAPPMYGLAKRLLSQGRRPAVILGFNNEKEIFLCDDFKALGIKTLITTLDGSRGIRGLVTDALPTAGRYTYVYACGPEPMLKAVYDKTVTSGQFSFEERMGCGFGACMGCTCKTKYGNKRICRDGPVLTKEEIIWD